MYNNVSEKYKEKLKSDEQQYTGYIQLKDGTKIEANGDLASISINDSLGSELIGNFAKKQVVLKVLNDTLNLTEKEFDLFVGLYLNKTDIEYVPYGTFLVKKIPDNDKAREEINLTAEDYTYKFDIKVNVELLKTANSVDELLNIICSEVEIIRGNVEFTNSKYSLKDIYYDEDSTYRDIVKQIAKIAGGNAKIGRDNKLYIKLLNVDVVKTIELNEQFEHKKSDVKYGPINAIVASRIVADDGSTTEDVYARDEQSIAENGITEIKIIQNDLIDNDRQSAVNELLSVLNGFQYIPGDFEIVGDPTIDSGDYAEIKDLKNRTKFNTIIQEHSLNIDTGLSTISSSMKTKTETDYKAATEKEKRRKTEIKVNKLEGKITSVVQEQTEQSEKITQYQQDINSFNFNLIKNSTLRLGLDKNVLTSGIISIEQFKNILDNTTSQSAIKINTGTVQFDRVKILENQEYTFSCKVYKNELTNVIIKIISDKEYINSINIEPNIFQEFEFSFVSSVDFADIIIQSDNNYALVADCMFNKGSKLAYQPFAGEVVGTGFNMSINGIELEQTEKNTKFVANASEVKVTNKHTGKGVVFGEETELYKAKCQEFTMGKIRYTALENGDVMVTRDD